VAGHSTSHHSSHFESLSALNSRFEQAGKSPMRIMLLPDALEDEDAMEMLNGGLLQIPIVDDWKARVGADAAAAGCTTTWRCARAVSSVGLFARTAPSCRR
jgi:hypothetical protein